MSTRTRLLAAVAVGTLCIAGTACSRDDGSASTDTGEPREKSATMVISTLNNPFFVTVKDGAVAQAEERGIDLEVKNANNSTQTEIDLVQTAVTQQPGALIIDPVDSQASTAGVKAANQAGVPVLGFDRKPDGGELSAFIGYDAKQAGRNAAKALAKKLGEKGKVVEIQGILGTNVANDRSEGFQEQIAEYPGIDVVATQSADFDRSKALTVMTDVLQANPDIDGVYAANDEMAMGVLSALKARGLQGDVALVGNDGIRDAFTAISRGDMYATNAESPYALGQAIVDEAADVIDGKDVEDDVVLQGKLITAEQVPAYCAHLVDLGDKETCPNLAN